MFVKTRLFSVIFPVFLCSTTLFADAAGDYEMLFGEMDQALGSGAGREVEPFADAHRDAEPALGGPRAPPPAAGAGGRGGVVLLSSRRRHTRSLCD